LRLAIIEPSDFYREECRAFFRRCRVSDFDHALHSAAMGGGCGLAQSGVARAKVNDQAGLSEAARDFEADALIGAGNEDDARG
jgi:hypothetical protein